MLRQLTALVGAMLLGSVDANIYYQDKKWEATRNHSHELHPKEAARRANNETLEVHIFAHTHDDVGWLKTVDQYYSGSD